MAMEKCYSIDDESFNHREVGEVFDQMQADGRMEEGEVYYEADCELMTPRDFEHRVDALLDDLEGDLYDEVGEFAELVFTDNLPEGAKEELTELLTGWIAKHIELGRFWKIVGKSREVVITAEDVAEFENAS